MITNAWQEGDFRFGHGDVLTFNDTGTGGGGARAVTLSSLVTPGSVIFDNSTSTYTVSGTGNMVGPSGLSKSGSGAVTLSNANSYTGGTTVTAGTLTTGSATALGSTSGQLTVNGGTLDMGSQSITVGNLTGTGGVISGTSGTRTLTIGQGNTGGGNYQGSIQNGASGTTALAKNGTGTLTLSGINTYTGATTVTGGTLLVNGNISTSSLTTVKTGATLGGNGTVGALTVEANGIVAPGNSPDTLDVNGAYNQLGIYQAEITAKTVGNGTTGYDQISVAGTVNITGGSLVTIFSGTGYVANDLIFILLNDSTDAITGTYATFAQDAVVTTFGGLSWKISYNADSVANTFTGTPNGNDIALMAIPEPNVASLIGALGGILLLRRRRG